MKEVCMIEPDGFAGDRVNGYGLPDLSCSQSVRASPLIFYSEGAAILFYRRSLSTLESVLPGQIHSLTVIPDVHHFLFDKPLFNSWIYQGNYFTVISDRRSSPLLRREVAIKPDLHRPVMRIRHFVMQMDKAIGRIFG